MNIEKTTAIMRESRDTSIAEARSALPLDGGVKCYGVYRSVPENESSWRNGLKKENENIE